MKNIEEKIEQTLMALNNLKRAPAPAKFEAAVMDRLRLVTKVNRWFQYSAAALVIFGLLNVITLTTVSNDAYDEMGSEYFMTSTTPALNFTEDE